VTYEQESQLRQVVLRFVQAVADRGASLPKIKLVKLLYLLDLDAWKRHGAPATGLDWLFFHYGPYAPDLEPVLERAEGVYFHRIELPRLQTQRLASTVHRLGQQEVPVENELVYLYRPIAGLPDEPIEDAAVSDLAGRVTQRWASEDTDSILAFVYATQPIARGRRYWPIDWNLEPREPGIFGNRARHFVLSSDLRASIEGTWSTWRESGHDVWGSYEPERWLFDDRWFAALARMDEDEAASPALDLRIRGPLPQPLQPDD
jgi:hypothetical protein